MHFVTCSSQTFLVFVFPPKNFVHQDNDDVLQIVVFILEEVEKFVEKRDTAG